MTRRRKVLLGLVLVMVGLTAAAWHWQSELIGISARWYLQAIRAREEATGDLTKRRETVARMHRLLLMPPPPDALVPELFDFVTAVSDRVARGEIDLSWAAYVYTSYERDLVRDRPDGTPRRTPAEIEAKVVEYVTFYHLQKRPDVPGVRVRDFVGDGPDSYSVDDIEQAHKEGRQLPMR